MGKETKILVDGVGGIDAKRIGEEAIESLEAVCAGFAEGEGGEKAFLGVVPVVVANVATVGTKADDLVCDEVGASVEGAGEAVVDVVGAGDEIGGEDGIPGEIEIFGKKAKTIEVSEGLYAHRHRGWGRRGCRRDRG